MIFKKCSRVLERHQACVVFKKYSRVLERHGACVFKKNSKILGYWRD